MIIKNISWDVRDRERSKARADKARGIDREVKRASRQSVYDSFRVLTEYLVDPAPDLSDRKFAAFEINYPEDRILQSYVDRRRVSHVITRNFLHDDLELQQWEVPLAMGGGLTDDPFEHIVISWPSGVTPSRVQSEALVDLLLAVSRIEGHQLFAVQHGDTPHTHLHIACSRLDPATGGLRRMGSEAHGGPIEALHQTIAIAAFRENWPTANGALYLADDQGCYERLTGIRVLDGNLNSCASADEWRLIRKRRHDHRKLDDLPKAALSFEYRKGVASIQRIARDEIAPMIQDAESGEEIHRGLAGLGIRLDLSKDGELHFGRHSYSAMAAGHIPPASQLRARFPDWEAPIDLETAEWHERVFEGKEHLALKESRRALIVMAQRATNQSVAAGISLVNHAAREAVDEAKQGRVAEKEIAALRRDRRATLSAIEELRKRASKKRDKWRLQLGLGDLSDAFLDECDPAEVNAILVACARGKEGWKSFPDYTAVPAESQCSYWLGERLAFTAYADRIDVNLVRSDQVLTDATELATAQWGRVGVVGDLEIMRRSIQPGEWNYETRLSGLPSPVGLYVAERRFSESLIAFMRGERNCIVSIPRATAKIAEKLGIGALNEVGELAVSANETHVPGANKEISSYPGRPRGEADGAFEGAAGVAPIEHAARHALASLLTEGAGPAPASGGGSQSGALRPINLNQSGREWLRAEIASREELRRGQLLQELDAAVHSLSMVGEGPSILGGHFMVRARIGAAPPSGKSPRLTPDDTFRIMLTDFDYSSLVDRYLSGKALPDRAQAEMTRWNGAYSYTDSRHVGKAELWKPDIHNMIWELPKKANSLIESLSSEFVLMRKCGKLVVPADLNRIAWTDRAAVLYPAVQSCFVAHYLMQDEERKDIIYEICSKNLIKSQRIRISGGIYPEWTFKESSSEIEALARKYRGDPSFFLAVSEARAAASPSILLERSSGNYRMRALERARSLPDERIAKHVEAAIRCNEPHLLDSHPERKAIRSERVCGAARRRQYRGPSR